MYFTRTLVCTPDRARTCDLRIRNPMVTFFRWYYIWLYRLFKTTLTRYFPIFGSIFSFFKLRLRHNRINIFRWINLQHFSNILRWKFCINHRCFYVAVTKELFNSHNILSRLERT